MALLAIGNRAMMKIYVPWTLGRAAWRGESCDYRRHGSRCRRSQRTLARSPVNSRAPTRGLGSQGPRSQGHFLKFLFSTLCFIVCSITVVLFFFPLLPPSTQLTPLTHSQSLLCCPCPWVIHTCSLTKPFPFLPPLFQKRKIHRQLHQSALEGGQSHSRIHLRTNQSHFFWGWCSLHLTLLIICCACWWHSVGFFLRQTFLFFGCSLGLSFTTSCTCLQVT